MSISLLWWTDTTNARERHFSDLTQLYIQHNTVYAVFDSRVTSYNQYLDQYNLLVSELFRHKTKQKKLKGNASGYCWQNCGSIDIKQLLKLFLKWNKTTTSRQIWTWMYTSRAAHITETLFKTHILIQESSSYEKDAHHKA